MTKVRRTHGWIVFGIVVAAASIATLTVTAQTVQAKPASPAMPLAATTTVATVDGTAIPLRELEIYLNQERAGTFAYYQKKFDASDSPAFWTTRHDGVTPAMHLQKLALADVTRATVQFELAYRHHLVESTSYGAFLNAWQSENARRLAALAAHTPIYGPQQYTEANYLDYALGDLAYQLESLLASDGSIDASDAALRAYYGAHASDFTNKTVPGPALGYDAAAVQVRLAYLNAQYGDLVDKLSKDARVQLHARVWKDLASDCVIRGGC